MNKNSIQMIFALLSFVVVAALAITFTYDKTKDEIEERERMAKESSLKNVLSHGSTAFADTIDGFGAYWKELDAKGRNCGNFPILIFLICRKRLRRYYWET